MPGPRRHPSSVVPETFLHGDSALARLARPVAQFLRVEASGGILLVAATIVALVWANSPWSDALRPAVVDARRRDGRGASGSTRTCCT